MIEVAKKAALEAGEIIVSHRNSPHTVKRKGTADDVTTEVDKLAEDKIINLLKKSFPNHNYWSEDRSKEDKGSNYTWVIDPLDGTGPFSVGMPFFGVSIGLIYKGEPILGVVNLPTLERGSLYWAQRKKGAFLNSRPIKVNQNKDLDKTMIGYDFAWMGMRNKEIRKYLSPVADKAKYTPFLGCTIAGLTYVASGVYGGYIHWGYIWDFAGGAAIIQEAGGKVTDPKGKKIDWSKETMTVVAGSASIHKKILSLIKK